MSSAIVRTHDLKVRYATDYQTTVICEIETDEGSSLGTARCSPEDTFNEAIGRRIAYFRALTAEATTVLNALENSGFPSVQALPNSVKAISYEEIDGHVEVGIR